MPEVSIICPMFNEESGAFESIQKLKRVLGNLKRDAEVIIINDGSTDKTLEECLRAIVGDSRFKIFSHKKNYGRGRALRTGFSEASGEYIITTEGDLSWGENIVQDLLLALKNEKTDAVFASPQEKGGGYKNVPLSRIIISRLGNLILRILYTGRITMVTGMTRGYKREVIQGHKFYEDGKEIHLEIAQRLIALGYNVATIPATLAWLGDKIEKRQRSQRTNWSRIFSLMRTHLAFGMTEGIGRVLLMITPALFCLAMFFGGWAIWAFIEGRPSIFLLIVSGVLVTLFSNLLLGYFILHHIMNLRIESWRNQQAIDESEKSKGAYYKAIELQ